MHSPCEVQDKFIMASQRFELREYHFGVLLLIIVNQLAKGNCLVPSASVPSTKSMNCTEILGRTLRTYNDADQNTPNVGKMEFTKVSPSTATTYPSRNPKIANETKVESDDCSKERKGNACPRFVDKYSSFYLKVRTKTFFVMKFNDRGNAFLIFKN